MRFEAWVTATGNGAVTPAALRAARETTGVIDCTRGDGSWRLGLVVFAATAREAAQAARDIARGVARSAGLPSWKVVLVSAAGPEVVEECGNGLTIHRRARCEIREGVA